MAAFEVVGARPTWNFIVTNNGGVRVGIGTTNPQGLLDLSGANPQTRLQYTGTASAFETLINFVDKRSSVNAAIGNNLFNDGLNAASAALVFKTANGATTEVAEKMRINPNGNVGIGTTNPTRKLFVSGDAGGTTAWSNDSDVRLKTNVGTIQGALGKVVQLRGVEFEWIDAENHPKGKQLGFIAQEAKEIIPEVVTEAGGYLGMQYGPINALLVEAIKELKAENDALKARLDTAGL